MRPKKEETIMDEAFKGRTMFHTLIKYRTISILYLGVQVTTRKNNRDETK